MQKSFPAVGTGTTGAEAELELGGETLGGCRAGGDGSDDAVGAAALVVTIGVGVGVVEAVGCPLWRWWWGRPDATDFAGEWRKWPHTEASALLDATRVLPRTSDTNTTVFARLCDLSIEWRPARWRDFSIEWRPDWGPKTVREKRTFLPGKGRASYIVSYLQPPGGHNQT